MTTRAQFSAWRGAILGDLLRLGESLRDGVIDRATFDLRHFELSLLLQQLNQWELDERASRRREDQWFREAA
jgi:hypothetical protein